MQLTTLGMIGLKTVPSLRQHQPLALLAYLAINGPQTRRHLSRLFWPAAKRPLNNLSSALTRIRQHDPGLIETNGERVTCLAQTDVADLVQAIEEGDGEQVAALYAGSFFDDVNLTMGIELEEWLFATRESLALAAADVLLNAAENSTGEQRVRLAEKAFSAARLYWVDASPWARVHRLVADSTHLADRVRLEAGLIGLSLERPSHKAAEPGSNPSLLSAAQTVASRPSKAELFGRNNELHKLTAFLAADQSGWLAVVGMGGVGKTTLVRAFHESIPKPSPDEDGSGVQPWMISLAGVTSVDRAVETVATELGAPSGELDDLVGHLTELTRTNPGFLVLDNCEQIPHHDALLEALAPIPNLWLIVTSRAITGHRSETVLRLGGLVGDDEAAAIALFTARASVASAADADRDQIAAVCSLVGGLPLAIELTAAWLETIPLRVIADSLDVSTELVDVSPQGAERTLDAVLRSSYERLSPSELQVLAALSLFDGTFGYSDAREAAETTLVSISRLVSASLLERTGDRLRLHPLVRSHAQAMLHTFDPELTETIERRFVEFLCAEIVAAARGLRGSEAGTVSSAVASRFDSFQAAWTLAVKRRDWDAVNDMADGMALHLKSQSRLALSAQLFGLAFDAVEASVADMPSDSSAKRTMVAVGWRLALTRLVQGDRLHAEEVVERCTLIRADGDRVGSVGLAYIRGHIASFAGNYDTAAIYFDEAKSLAQDSVAPSFLAEIQTGRAMVAVAQNETEVARRLIRSALDVGRRVGNPVVVGEAYYFLGVLELHRDPEAALMLLEEAQQVAADASLNQQGRKYATVIGRCHIRLGDAAHAIEVFEAALADSVSDGQVHEPWVRLSNLSGLARALDLAGDRERSTRLFAEAVRAQVRHSDWPLLLETIIDVCRTRTDQAQSRGWQTLIGIAANHEATQPSWRPDIDDLLAKAELTAVPTTVADADDGLSIDLVGEQTLALLRA